MLPTKYSSTRNKDRVREEDIKLIRKGKKRKAQKLSYLGMPSGEMKDILAWREYIDRFTAIEIDEGQRRKLILNIIRNGLMDRVDVLFGDIEDILIKGKDKYTNKLKFPYSVVFLDFFGTILYQEFHRVKAIKALINQQIGNQFVLLLTFNLRERRFCRNIVINVLDKIQKELLSLYAHDDLTKGKIKKILSWYASPKTHEMYRQKLFVPYFIKTTAEECNFNIHTYSPIFYKGFNKNPMIHFMFKLLPQSESPTKAVSEQTIIDIVNLNIKESSKGRVFLLKKQAPILKIAKPTLNF